MMKKLFGLFLVGVLFSAVSHAQYQFESLNPSCPLKKFVNGKWENASASELANKSLPAPRSLSGSATAVGIKFNNVWYSAPSQCFMSTSATTQTSPSDESSVLMQEPAEASKKTQTSRKSEHYSMPSFYIRLEGGYLLSTDSESKARSDSSSGLLVNYTKAKNPITFGGALGWNASENYSLEMRVLKSGKTQTGTSPGVGTIAEDTSFLDIHLGAYYHFIRGSISPFLGANLGYSSVSTTLTLSDFNSFPTYNGAVKATGSGIGYGVVLGCDFNVAGNFAIVPTVTYKSASFGKAKVSTSSSAVYSGGEELSETKFNAFLFGLGLQLSF